MRTIRQWLWVAVLGFATAAPAADTHYAKLSSDIRDTMALFKQTDPSLKKFFENSAGFAVFPNVAKGAFGVGAAQGEGQVFEKGRPVGATKMTQITVGFQLGGQVYAEVIFFEDRKTLQEFKEGNVEFSAQVSAVAAAEGASQNAKYKLGVAVFTIARSGLMFEASIGGQKFSFDPYPDSGSAGDKK